MTDIAFTALLSAICYVESSHNPAAINHDDGKGDSIGYCQVKLKTARWMGYQGEAKGLLNPSVNKKYAARYLRKQLHRYHGNQLQAISAYNCGHVCNNPSYVNKVLRALEDRR